MRAETTKCGPQMQNKLTFAPASAFHGELRRRVDAYFTDNNLKKSANGFMVAKTAFWLAFTWGAWALTMREVVSFPLSIALWCAQGFGFACIGFNIGHDAIHGSYSDKKWVNAILAWSFDVMGASSFTWRVAHNVIHHTYTNIPGHDGDLEPGPTMVFYPQPTRWFHRFQHIYAWALYPFIGVIWVYIKDFEQIRRGDPLTGKTAGRLDFAQMMLGKGLHIGLVLAAPLVFMHAPAWQILIGYSLLLATGGVTLAVVFQLAHCIEGVEFPRTPEGAQQMPVSWCEHQLRTTANFGRTALATFICGGLDHQIEHHLMPRICHIHYPALAPIVEQCAREHGLPYVHNGSFFRAVGAHARTLRRLGQGAAVVETAALASS